MGARIDDVQKNISVIIQDSRLGDLAKITYPLFGTDVSYGLCAQAENDPLCDHDTIAFVPANTSVTYKEESVYQNNQKLFSLRDVFSFPNLEFQFINQDGYSLQFAVYNNSTLLGILALRWKSRVPDVSNTRDDSYKIQILKS
jgi:hypothetical protein